jgi:hypothetical protein
VKEKTCYRNRNRQQDDAVYRLWIEDKQRDQPEGAQNGWLQNFINTSAREDIRRYHKPGQHNA